MKKFMWILLATVLSATLTFAQDACLSLETALRDALSICDELGIGTICYGTGDITLDASAEGINFESPGDTADLSEIASLQTENTENTLAIAMMRLNREDVALDLIIYGDTEIENTAPRHTINVYALRNVNLREEPSVDATVIGSLVQGRDYIAVGRLADNAWIRVSLDDGRIGWASAQYFNTREGFTELDAVTPSTPPYLPMQSVTINTGDCAGLIIIAPEIEEENLTFGINGAQIQVNGIAHFHTEDDLLIVEALEGEVTVNTFGFELPLRSGEMTSVPMSDANMIIGIGTDAEAVEEAILSDESLELLLSENSGD